MPRNPKQDQNLKPIKKGDLTDEELKKRASNGGKKSGEARRKKRDAKQAARYILDLAAKGKVADNLTELGIKENDQTNMVALQTRLFTMAISGNIDAYMTLMKIAGYDPKEIRDERESVNADRRRDTETKLKAEAMASRNMDNADVSVNLNNEDGASDVVIYLPRIEDPESLEMPEEEDGEDG